MRTALGALRRAIALVAVVAAVGGLLGTTGGPAGAQSGDDGAPARTQTFLTLVVVPTIGGGWAANLMCEPPGGTHPAPAEACRDLAAARGNFAELPGDPGVDACMHIYDPVTVYALGVWRNQPVWYSYQYGNSCLLRDATGPVFALARASVNAAG